MENKLKNVILIVCLICMEMFSCVVFARTLLLDDWISVRKIYVLISIVGIGIVLFIIGYGIVTISSQEEKIHEILKTLITEKTFIAAKESILHNLSLEEQVECAYHGADMVARNIEYNEKNEKFICNMTVDYCTNILWKNLWNGDTKRYYVTAELKMVEQGTVMITLINVS